jgi:ribonuclease PH
MKRKIVAYTGSGKPLSRKEYNKRLAEAEKQIERVNTLLQEELEKQAKTW